MADVHTRQNANHAGSPLKGPGVFAPLSRAAGSLTRHALFSLALAAGGLVGTACGGSPPSGIANLDSTTTTTPASSVKTAGSGDSTAARYKAALVYVDCMRAHGEPSFPDPTSDGQINDDFSYGGKGGAPASSGIDRTSPQFLSAAKTCLHLVPGGIPTPAQNQQALTKDLKFAQCMQTHGVPNFPDPTSAGVVRLIGVDQNSPQYQRAQNACDALVPGAYSK